MTFITVKFTAQELELLTSLASDQLFRKEFIDSRLPGLVARPAEIESGKLLLNRLRNILDPGYSRRLSASRITG